MSSEPDREAWLAVLSRYDLGQVTQIAQGSGTALAKVVVETTAGRFIVRRRRPAWSTPDVVAFDHSVIERIADAGLPTPRPARARDGKTWTCEGDVAYEAFPFMGNLGPLTPESVGQLESAAITLARFHRATVSGGFRGAKPWPREHEIGTMAATLAAALVQPSISPAAAEGQRMLDAAQALAAQLTPALVAELPSVVIHGDYTPANILFRGDQVGGIFDYDWVTPQPRLVDVGEAIEFFAFRRATPIDPGSIWSLVQGWEPDVARMNAFLAAYQSVWPLTQAEAQALALFMRETWLGVRIRAMRKVPAEQRLEILTQDALKPLLWLTDSGALIVKAVRATQQ